MLITESDCGLDRKMTRQDFENRWAQTLHADGDDPQALLPVALDAVAAFPQDWQFLYRAAVSELRIAQQLPAGCEKAKLLGDAMAHAQRSIKEDLQNRIADWVLREVSAMLPANTDEIN